MLAGETMCGDIANSARRKCGSVWAGDFSLSLSLSRCSHFLARLWVKFKGLFYSFYRSFFLFYRSFFSSFYLQKAFFRVFCLFEIFKCFVFGLFALVIASRLPKNGGFCHFERSEKSKEFKIRFVYGYFANAQYDKFRVCKLFGRFVWKLKIAK